jgi:hypothetical protein
MPARAGRILAIIATVTALCLPAPARSGSATPSADPVLRSMPAKRAKPLPQRTPGPIPLPTALKIPRYEAGPPPFNNGETLVYDAAWAGIPAAEARITVTHNRLYPQSWTGQMWINTSKVADPLYRMRDYIREDFGRESLRPDEMYILQHEKKRLDEWRVKFDEENHLVVSVKKNRAGRIWTRRFSGGDPWGPFSGAMMALSQPLTVGQTYTFDVFSGGNRYVFSFAVQQREQITTALGTFNTLRIEPSVLWLSEGSFRSQARDTTIWVTDDARHLPVRIESAVFIGTVRADLTQIVNAAVPTLKPPATQAARSASQRPDP